MTQQHPSLLNPRMLRLATHFFAAGLWAGLVAAQSNAPPGVLTWCGKAYNAADASFDPGGWLSEPSRSSDPLLYLTIRPHMSLYLAGETSAEFIIDAMISHIVGKPLNSSNAITSSSGAKSNVLSIEITMSTGESLVSGASILINTTANQISVDLTKFTPRMKPYDVTLSATSADGSSAYNSTTQLSYLPQRTDGGSVVKVDSLYRGMMVQPYQTSGTNSLNTSTPEFVPIFPYSFYMSGSYVTNNSANVASFAQAGYNILHIVPSGASDATESFGSVAELGAILDDAEANGLYLMYDMRSTYKNLTAVAEAVKLWGNRKSMLLWYTADEPDGQVDPLNVTKLAYDTIKDLDPYHPVSLVLNCYNYHYEQHSAGADIILEDVYPIGNNMSYSTTWNTTCNTTYGDCGCDDCTDQGGFSDISKRQDTLNRYDTWLGRAGTKVKWGVPQGFTPGEYWLRNVTSDEEAVMYVLRINHGATGLMSWLYPTSDEIERITSALSKIIAKDPVMSFLIGASPMMELAYSVDGKGKNGMDAAAWYLPAKKQLLVSIINMDYQDYANDTSICVTLPMKVSGVGAVQWGSAGWTVAQGGNSIARGGMKGLGIDLVIFDVV